jgi:hypothetical protein
LTPADVHHGLAQQRVTARATVLAIAYAAHPERFPAGPPAPAPMPTEVWINRPQAPCARGGGAYSLNSRPDCLIPVDRLHARLCLEHRAALASMRLIRVERRRSASLRGSHTV